LSIGHEKRPEGPNPEKFPVKFPVLREFDGFEFLEKRPRRGEIALAVGVGASLQAVTNPGAAYMSRRHRD
jgi:hypothetical protein